MWFALGFCLGLRPNKVSDMGLELLWWWRQRCMQDMKGTQCIIEMEEDGDQEATWDSTLR